jgi:hypothetical protein
MPRPTPFPFIGFGCTGICCERAAKRPSAVVVDLAAERAKQVKQHLTSRTVPIVTSGKNEGGSEAG